ncbi:PREDICTED: transmembrane protein 209-like [Priapulus caudatus]|uniref:Transmembrane protein 209-like n=1 Tax=Priapulus caudatus TaxID=37621 RepID=A0ABM1EBN6_PRICU|nr:PREDICTED: transmembrane protein 209-like [Priapulus caudatus]
MLWHSGRLGKYFDFTWPVVSTIECILAIWFGLNAIICAVNYMWPTLGCTTIELTMIQQRLLRIKGNEPGFRTFLPRLFRSSASRTSATLYSQGSPLMCSSSSPYRNHSLHASAGYSPSRSPGHLSLHGQSAINRVSPGRSGTFQRHSPVGGAPYSPGDSPYTPSGSPYSPSGAYERYSPSEASPYSPGSTPVSSSFVRRSPGSGNAASPGVLRTRSFSRMQRGSNSTVSPIFAESPDSFRVHYHGSPSHSPAVLTSDGAFTDVNTLNCFLHEETTKDQIQQISNLEASSASQSQSFWSYGKTPDYTQLLRKFQYQASSRLPHHASLSSSSHKDDDVDTRTTYEESEVWSKLAIHRETLDRWTENIRKWLCQTILVRLIAEIGSINDDLDRLGCGEIKIGDVSISSLRQISLTRGQHIPTLNTVLPYLDVTSNQEYLVNRIRELGSGGCMSEYRWNGGGSFKGKPWDEHLISDAGIVMHMLCTYLDGRLPPHPKYPDGRTFTSQYFVKTPDKPSKTKKDQLCIYQSHISPPHYRVIIAEHTWDVPQGRNNLLHAILLFLYHIRTKENGMLGRVNLGLSGVNVMWVLDQAGMEY